MAAANWVCRALLLSLCMGMCYGNRAGQYTTMNKGAKEMVMSLNHGNNISGSKHDVGDSSSSRGPINGNDLYPLVGVEGVYCSSEDNCDDHIIVPEPAKFIVGCQQLRGYSQCIWKMDDIDTISGLLSGIQQKLDETCWRSIAIDSIKMDAMAPKSG